MKALCRPALNRAFVTTVIKGHRGILGRLGRFQAKREGVDAPQLKSVKWVHGGPVAAHAQHFFDRGAGAISAHAASAAVDDHGRSAAGLARRRC
jgi:hypothetical protein